jgi:zinc transporter ZupT
MEESFWPPFLASTAAAVVTTVGLLSIRRFADWSRRNSIYFVSFAAGVLVSVSFMHIVPKCMQLSPAAPAWLLAGFFLLHGVNRFIHGLVCHRGGDETRVFGLVPLLGIGFHSLIDGVVYSITFSVSTFTGVLAAIGMVLHEFPEGIVTYVLLLQAGYTPRRSLLYAFLAAALSTPLGMLVSFPFVSRIGPDVLGDLLAASAGALIYVGAAHLLPQAERESRRYSLLALLAGLAVAIGIAWSGH